MKKWLGIAGVAVLTGLCAAGISYAAAPAAGGAPATAGPPTAELQTPGAPPLGPGVTPPCKPRAGGKRFFDVREGEPKSFPRPHPHPAAPFFGLAIPVLFVIGAAAVILVAVLAAHRTAQLRLEAIMLATREGKEIPRELWHEAHHRRDPLLGGLLLAAAGVGLSVALGLTVSPAAASWGAVPFLMGLVNVVYAAVRKRRGPGNEK